jgi:hypothetical protein
VATTTAVVYIPNRIVVSGLSGINTFKGCVNVNVYDANTGFTPTEVSSIFLNGQVRLSPATRVYVFLSRSYGICLTQTPIDRRRNCLVPT